MAVFVSARRSCTALTILDWLITLYSRNMFKLRDSGIKLAIAPVNTATNLRRKRSLVYSLFSNMFSIPIVAA